MTQSDLDQQKATFDRVMDDGKVMFVSHVIRYGSSNSTTSIRPDLFYSAYSHTAFGLTEVGRSYQPNSVYEGGWKALDALESEILSDIQTASQTGKPFTHIVLAAMGWNNDQLEAVERYNAIIEHSKRAASRRNEQFNPIVIGLTWPSVWGGSSVLDLANRALHITSYPAKTDDADEIGYGISNYVVNAMLPRIEASTGLQSVLVGHSMGARMLTRAYYSRDLLIGSVTRNGSGPLVVGLQGAFSANRFRSNHTLIQPISWIRAGEGGPYQNKDSPRGVVILTWSEDDRANPIARYATGAAHVGGKTGPKVMAKQEIRDKVHSSSWGNREAFSSDCAIARAQERILYIDTTEIIRSHGDIRNPDVGELLWRSIECYGR